MTIFPALLAQPLLAQQTDLLELLPRSDSEIYQCLVDEDGSCGNFSEQIELMELDLGCYRECVAFCQEVTDSIFDERQCINDNCLEGGAFGC